MNYKIIYDEAELDRFISWLPNLQPNEKFYWSLFCRKKYFPQASKSNDKTQLKRGLATKENLKDKIRQLEIEIGKWKLRDMEVPQESLVFYLMPNPRCMTKATYKTIRHCADLLENTNKGYNLVQEVMSCVQKSKSRTVFVDFDIDDKNIDLTLLNHIFPPVADSRFPDKPYTIIETRGGYHILINSGYATAYMRSWNAMQMRKREITWYNDIKSAYIVDQVQDQLLPVPGTIQGGFEVKFINI